MDCSRVQQNSLGKEEKGYWMSCSVLSFVSFGRDQLESWINHGPPPLTIILCISQTQQPTMQEA
eukprot:scaffold738_cov124-Cylindrotheca_fusiformis.AAC.5